MFGEHTATRASGAAAVAHQHVAHPSLGDEGVERVGVEDLVVVAGAECSRLDPSARNGVGAKMALDATRPLTAEPMSAVRIRVPGEEAVDLSSLVDTPPPDGSSDATAGPMRSREFDVADAD